VRDNEESNEAATATPILQDAARFQDYRRRELPGLVRQLLDKDVSSELEGVQHFLHANLLRYVESCIDQLVQGWQLPLSLMSPSATPQPMSSMRVQSTLIDPRFDEHDSDFNIESLNVAHNRSEMAPPSGSFGPPTPIEPVLSYSNQAILPPVNDRSDKHVYPDFDYTARSAIPRLGSQYLSDFTIASPSSSYLSNHGMRENFQSLGMSSFTPDSTEWNGSLESTHGKAVAVDTFMPSSYSNCRSEQSVGFTTEAHLAMAQAIATLSPPYLPLSFPDPASTRKEEILHQKRMSHLKKL
jgi:hypothetical protein